MRKRYWGAALLFFVPSVAFAQDAIDVWTGGYIGLDVGGGRGTVVVTDTHGGVPPGPFSYWTWNILADLTAGYNFQAGAFVLGVEGRVGYLDPLGKGLVPSSDPAFHQDLTISPGLTAELSGKVGLAVEHTLIYAKGGIVIFNGQSQQVTTKPGYQTEPSGTFKGWTAGVGVEQMVTDNVSLRAEYAHTDYGVVTGDQLSIGDPPIGYKYFYDTKFTTDAVTMGVNFHF
jgi:outer membrane immunogenic protein